MSEVETAVEAWRALQTPESFTERYLAPDTQYLAWYRQLDAFLQENPLALILVHPGSGKSTRIGLIQCLREICLDRSIRIGYFSKTADKASYFMTSISRELRHNERLIHDFGTFFDEADPQVLWNTRAIRVQGSERSKATPTLVNLGVASQIEGLRFDWLIMDDPIDLHTALSAAESSMMDKLFGMLIDRLDPGGRILIIGHRFLPNDFYQQLIETRPSVAPLILPAINEKGEPLAPELWPGDSIIKEKKERHKSWEWSAWFMQERVAPEDSVFNGAARQLVPSLPEGARLVAALDPAYSTSQESDWTVCAIGCQDQEGGIIISDIRDWRISKGWSSQSLDYAFTNGARELHIEINNAQTLGEETRQLARQRGLPIQVHDYRSKGSSKEFRLGELADRAREGKVRFLDGIQKREAYLRLCDQWDVYPNLQHDDHLDAIDILRRVLTASRRSVGIKGARI